MSEAVPAQVMAEAAEIVATWKRKHVGRRYSPAGEMFEALTVLIAEALVRARREVGTAEVKR